MQIEVTHLVAWGLSVLGLLGAAIVRDRYLLEAIRRGDEQVRELTLRVAEQLHSRVNDVRDEFVRRVDHDGHSARVERQLEALHAQMAETNRRIDSVMVAVKAAPVAVNDR